MVGAPAHLLIFFPSGGRSGITRGALEYTANWVEHRAGPLDLTGDARSAATVFPHTLWSRVRTTCTDPSEEHSV